jgi:hypothetical protein
VTTVQPVQPVQPAQPAQPGLQRGTWRPNGTLAQWCCIALVVMAALSAGEMIAHANRIRVAGDYHAGNATLSALHNADTFVTTMAVLWTIGLLGTAALFITWQWRSAKNAELTASTPPRWSPGWSIGGWFIPLANWVIPYLCVREISRSTTRQGDLGISSERSLLPWWWAAFVGMGVLRFIGNSMSGAVSSYSEFRARDGVWFAGALLGVAAAVLAVLVVRRLTELQEGARATAAAMPVVRVDPQPEPVAASQVAASQTQTQPQTQVPAQAGPAAGWYPDPLGRSEHRYWDGAAWTPHVSNAGVVGHDSPGG